MRTPSILIHSRHPFLSKYGFGKFLIKASAAELVKSKSQIDALTNNLVAAETTIKDLQTAIVELKAAPPPPPAGSGTTTSTNGLTATIVPNIFGSSAMTFNTVAGSGVTQTFQFQLSNATGKVANNIQLVEGFQVMNSTLTATQALPAGVTATLTMQGFFGAWTAQTTGDLSQLVFTNAAGTGIFANLNSLNQPVGTATYTMNLTLTTPPAGAIGTFMVMPIVKVQSFTP